MLSSENVNTVYIAYIFKCDRDITFSLKNDITIHVVPYEKKSNIKKIAE